MSLYKCERCNGIFHSSGKLQRHLNSNKIPCDFLCNICGIKTNSIMQYKRHSESKCEPKPILSSQLADAHPIMNTIVTTITTTITGVPNNNITSNITTTITSNDIKKI